MVKLIILFYGTDAKENTRIIFS
uniref:Uncharacterized protein n=1 Tax=Vitis vinifera TaxID=29760 RepID=F6I012_VITVI